MSLTGVYTFSIGVRVVPTSITERARVKVWTTGTRAGYIFYFTHIPPVRYEGSEFCSEPYLMVTMLPPAYFFFSVFFSSLGSSFLTFSFFFST